MGRTSALDVTDPVKTSHDPGCNSSPTRRETWAVSLREDRFMVAPPAGYSGTPLQKKLGITEGMVVCAPNAPDGFGAEFTGVKWKKRLTAPVDLVVAFHAERSTVNWPALTNAVGPYGVVWVAWPKKSSKVPTDLTEDVWREVVLPTGWVDVKVCAIDDVWSGLKFVLRKELRPKH